MKIKIAALIVVAVAIAAVVVLHGGNEDTSVAQQVLPQVFHGSQEDADRAYIAAEKEKVKKHYGIK